MNSEFSVVIPLYNKEREVCRAVESVLTQTLAPCEVIVVDDGSTDRGAEAVAALGSPLVRVVRQENAGVSAARNRGAAEARGSHVAFLDADDYWRDGYLAKIRDLTLRYPGCGLYAAAFDIASGDRLYPNRHPSHEGMVEEFFREAMSAYICQPSAVVIPRDIFLASGGFPPGMKLGEDLWFWIRMADRWPVCFTPEPLVVYSRTASNRSASIYTPEQTLHSFEELYRPEEGNSFRNEYIARCAIGKALTLSAKGDTAYGLRTERFFSYTVMYRRGWRKLHMLNRIPAAIRPALHSFYNRLAWAIARRGL